MLSLKGQFKFEFYSLMYGLYNDANYSHILKNLSAFRKLSTYGRMYKQVSLTYNLSEGTLLSPKLILLSQI